MPKLKTHKGIAKRVKRTGSGKITHRKASRSHLLAHKQAATKRTYVKDIQVAAGDEKNIKKMLGNYS